MNRCVAITGATGFLGRYVVSAFVRGGWRVRILARRPVDHPQLADLPLDVVAGDLSNRQALHTLVTGADVIVHAAGVIKARTSRGFEAVNVQGTENLARIIEECGSRSGRVLLVSSMAAREPTLSSYARTKRAAEQLLGAVLASRQLLILRPCVIYGPWDRETLALFRAVDHHIFLRPRSAAGRIALIHVTDVAAAIVALSEQDSDSAIFELTDDRICGYSWEEIGQAAEAALNSKALVLSFSAFSIRAVATLSWLAANFVRRTPMFTPGKARELLHSDWGSSEAAQPPRTLWRPVIGLAQGFHDTVRWYRDRRWIAAR